MILDHGVQSQHAVGLYETTPRAAVRSITEELGIARECCARG